MALENLTTNLMTQLDNPECSYLTGMMMGSGLAIRLVIMLFVFNIGFKMIDKLTIDPLVKWIKKKIYKR